MKYLKTAPLRSRSVPAYCYARTSPTGTHFRPIYHFHVAHPLCTVFALAPTYDIIVFRMSEIPELLERYRRGAELVAVAITGAAGPELDFKPAPDKWSVRQLVAHLADAEAANVVRLRQVISEDNPTLFPFDQNAWAEKTDYAKRKPSQCLETMRILRADNYQLLKDLPSETYNRSGTHLRRGVMTLLDMLRLFAEHAEQHAMQIRDVRAQYKASRAKAAG
jgi:hypothetical protein